MSPAYYNEIDVYAAAWLRNLIAAGHIAPGEVDERSIVDVRPSDLVGFGQCHWFAGLGGWSLALRLAGWPDDKPVFTGSCPCQPFSAAGRGGGFDDARHLWPEFFRLIAECRPPIVFGEQVESAVRLGWLDTVFGDLEGQDYACGAIVLGAHSVSAPHIRQRLWWVGQLADAANTRQRDTENAGTDRSRSSALQSGRQRQSGVLEPERGGETGGVGLTDSRGWETRRVTASPVGQGSSAIAAGSGFWSGLEWLPCRDGKQRPTQRRFQSMVDGIWPSMVDGGLPYLSPLSSGQKNRVGMLRGAGNAIVPQVAAEFIQAVMEVRP